MQNTKQVLDGDKKDIFKRKREFYLDEDLVDKIDSIEYGAQVNKIEEIEVNGVPVEPDESKTVKLKIPRVINAVTSDSESDALSAAMGKYLYTLISEGGGGGGGGSYTAGNGINIIGNVISNTLPGAVVSSAAPANPSKGTSWYDTTNDELKTYDGSQWNVTGKEYNAGEGIAIGQLSDYSAMRGPCPEGFHVPSLAEVQKILDVANLLGYSQVAHEWIKAPYNGCIAFLNGSVDAYYSLRTCTSAHNTIPDGLDAYLFSYEEGDSQGHVQPLAPSPKSIGAGVRGFADIPVQADATWTVLKDGTRGAFYRNSTLGLISVLNKNTDEWITLQDKNVGAENVGDNGLYFQRGNNYGFTSASEATSSEKVDASGYAPSTYSALPINTRYDWSSVVNANLWGGVTGVVTIDNVISNTGVLSVNGQTGHVTVESGGKQSFFKTQAEYDALPASKNTDGNLYIIVDTHFSPMPFAELIQLTPAPDAILAELNKYPKEYAEYYYENDDIRMDEVPSSELPRADAYLKIYNFTNIDNYIFVDTNLTEQEIDDQFTQEQSEAVLAGEWFFIRHKEE